MNSNLIFLITLLSPFIQMNNGASIGADLSSVGGLTMGARLTQQAASKSGLLFDIGRYRGTEYTDSQSIDYNLRYRPISITNDSTISIDLQLAFLTEYEHGDEKFRIIPLPKEWGIDDGNWDVMWEEFPKYLNKPVLDVTIAPGETAVIAIGELVSRPVQFSINIDALVGSTGGEKLSACESLMKPHPLSDSRVELGLKLAFGESCIVIPCGQVVYP